METPTYVSVDTIPELAGERMARRQYAEELLGAREAQIQSGEQREVPLAVDALSSGRRVLETARQFGVDSPQYQEAREGLFLDSHRLISEWRRKNTDEYFPLIEHKRDEETGDYLAHGASVFGMTVAALVPVNQREEEGRRVNEHVEEATAMKIGSLGAMALSEVIEQQPVKLHSLGGLVLENAVRVRTVSECTDWAIRLLKENKKTGYGGYVPEIEKLMVRDMIIDPETGQRYEEQMGLPGTYLNHDIIQTALLRGGFDAGNLDKTDLHGTQLLANDDLIDFIELLDTVASEEWCVPIFKGEVVSDDHPRDYAVIRQEAIVRQEALKSHATMVTDFIITLCEEGTDPREAPEAVEQFVKHMLIAIAQENLPVTAEIFDEQTAIGLREVASLQANGRQGEALELLNLVIAAAPQDGYCGAGSCGLERAGVDSAESIKKLGFDAKDTLLDKGGRKCRDCGKKNVVVYDTKKKMKGCIDCKATAKY